MLKQHLRITNDREDAYLDRLALAATQMVELEIGHSIDATYTDGVPLLLQQVVLLVAAHLFEDREGATDRRIDEVPLGVQRIITSFWTPEVC